MAIEGYMQVRAVGGSLEVQPPPRGELSLDLSQLTSGNAVYDAELARRLDLRSYPRSTIVLGTASRLPGPCRYSVRGELTLHGVTRVLDGAVSALLGDDGTWSVSGETVFDIRDFQVETPSLLMLRIFPDVKVTLKVALRAGAAGPGAVGGAGAGAVPAR